MGLYQFSKIAVVFLVGLVAGLLYGFQCSVNKGLGQLGDKEYLLGFQSINKAILNPVFFISFMGCLVVLPIACWLCYRIGDSTAFNFLLAATIIYFVGFFGVTVFGNVPLNETLANFNINAASIKQLAIQRKAFAPSWNKYHLIRTIAAIISFILTILSIIKI